MLENDKGRALEYLKQKPIVHMGTTGPDGAPWVRAMSIARVDDDLTVWIATFKKSNKVAHLEGNPRVCISAFEKGVSFRGFGTASLVDDAAMKETLWEEDWRCYFPEGPTDPNLVLAKMSIEKVELWSMA